MLSPNPPSLLIPGVVFSGVSVGDGDGVFESIENTLLRFGPLLNSFPLHPLIKLVLELVLLLEDIDFLFSESG